MDDETRSAIAGLGEEMRTSFARIDRYFELNQSQYDQLQQEVRAGFAAVDRRFASNDARFDSLEAQVSGLRSELRNFRDWVTAQFAELRTWLRDLTRRIEALEHR